MPSLKRGPTPYYHQIGAILREKLASGEFQLGDRIPSEMEIQRTFNVSRTTVRKALLGMEQEGLIERIPGKGSFVRHSGDRVAELKITCFLDDLITQGIAAHIVISEMGLVGTSRVMAEILEVRPGESAFTFIRTIIIEESPFATQRVFLPSWMERHLNEENLVKPHLLETISNACNVRVETTDQIIEAALADASQAARLDIDTGSALLSVTRKSCDRMNQPVEYSTTLYRSDRTRFSVSHRQRQSANGGWVFLDSQHNTGGA